MKAKDARVGRWVYCVGTGRGRIVAVDRSNKNEIWVDIEYWRGSIGADAISYLRKSSKPKSFNKKAMDAWFNNF